MSPDPNPDYGRLAEDPLAILRTSVIYQRLDSIGLCGRVRCYFLHKTDGSVGSLIVDDRAGFVEELLASGRFCEDSHSGGMLHGGMMSLRETSPDANQALHFSFGSGDYVWVHTDTVSPNAGSKLDGKCQYERRRTARHIRRDVLHVRRDLEALLFRGP
jgi:hypothetical protein